MSNISDKKGLSFLPICEIAESSVFVDMIGVCQNVEEKEFDDLELPLCVTTSIERFNEGYNDANVLTCSPFCGCHEPIDQMCYVFFSLKCEKAQDVAFYVFRSDSCKHLWVDGELLDYAANYNFYTLSLSPGMHQFVWRYSSFASGSGIQVRMTSLENDIKNPLTSWTQNNIMLNEPKFNLIDITRDIDTSKTAIFYIACSNRLQTDYERGLELSVVKYPSSTLLEKRICHVNEIVSIDMNEYGDDEYILLNWRCWDKEGRTFESTDPYYYGSVRKQLERIYTKGTDLLNAELSAPEQAYINKLLNEIKFRLDNHAIHVYYNFNLEKKLDEVANGKYKERLHTPGWVIEAVPKSLDDKPSEYRLYIPVDYDPTKKYPIIVRYATFYDVSTVRNFAFNKWNKSFVLDIDAGGITFGSYIGEALFLETLNHVIDKYPIDTNRIYGSGFCAGASGIFAIAEENPDLFAAIAVYGGDFNHSKVENLNNIPIIHFEAERIATFFGYKNLFSNNRSYKLNYANDFGHQILETISLNSLVFDELLTYKKECEPDEIDFTTSSLRHRKSYWVTVNSFESNDKMGRIVAKRGINRIEINTANISSFSITIPEQYDGFRVVIDGKTTNNACVGDTYCYVDSPQGFKIHEKGIVSSVYEGSGLLDVYYSPMIVVNCLTNDRHAKRTAIAISNPSNNSYCPKIYVSYPVIYEIPASYKTRLDHSFVIIDSNIDFPYLNDLRERCSAKMDKNGYIYNGEEYLGDYCIMEVSSNPDNNNHSILYINTNNTTLLRQNLITRKMIIPTYLNGRHPILNSNIYIFKRKKRKRSV